MHHLKVSIMLTSFSFLFPVYWQRDMCGTIMALQACPLYREFYFFSCDMTYPLPNVLYVANRALNFCISCTDGMGMVSIFWTVSRHDSYIAIFQPAVSLILRSVVCVWLDHGRLQACFSPHHRHTGSIHGGYHPNEKRGRVLRAFLNRGTTWSSTSKYLS